jgi:hypothetical protein
MKAMLFPVGCNELLDFVHHSYSAFSDLAVSILAPNALDAAWRFISPKIRCSMLERAQSIQATTSFNYSCDSQGARRLIQVFDLYHSTGI